MSEATIPVNPMRALVVTACVGHERDSPIYEMATDLLYLDEMQNHRAAHEGALATIAPVDLLTDEEGEALAKALKIVIVHRKLMEEVETSQPERRLEASGAIDMMRGAEDGLLLMLVAMAQKHTWLPGDRPASLPETAMVKGAHHA